MEALLLTLPANGTFVVHVNGIDVERPEPPEGEPGPSVAATGSHDTADAAEQWETLTIPAELLVIGENTITVEALPGEALPGETAGAGSAFDAQGVLARTPAR